MSKKNLNSNNQKKAKVLAIAHAKGGTGKTTLTALLTHYLENMSILSYETINEAVRGTENLQVESSEKLKSDILRASKNADFVVADFGTSQISDLINALGQDMYLTRTIDTFIVPVLSDSLVGTQKTVEALISVGVEPKNIKVVPNFAIQNGGFLKGVNLKPFAKTFQYCNMMGIDSSEKYYLEDEGSFKNMILQELTMQDVMEMDAEELHARWLSVSSNPKSLRSDVDKALQLATIAANIHSIAFQKKYDDLFNWIKS